jgi:hypothetical protein
MARNLTRFENPPRRRQQKVSHEGIFLLVGEIGTKSMANIFLPP